MKHDKDVQIRDLQMKVEQYRRMYNEAYKGRADAEAKLAIAETKLKKEHDDFMMPAPAGINDLVEVYEKPAPETDRCSSCGHILTRAQSRPGWYYCGHCGLTPAPNPEPEKCPECHGIRKWLCKYFAGTGRNPKHENGDENE
jgi:ribosomal protein S27AE